MKKIIASAVGLILAGGMAATTASAVESQFGGYWRTRAFIQDNFDGTDTATHDRIDNRTRLYYTAKFNDDFKFVNKFEFNSKWGDGVGGDLGADGNTWVVKNSYVNFNLGPVNTKVGIMGAAIARGFIFDNDFSGIMMTGKFGNVSVPVFYIRADDEDNGGTTDNDIFGGMAAVKISDALSVTPYYVYMTVSGQETDHWFLGADVDMKMDVLSAWGTFIYNGGTYMNLDNKGWLIAAGVDAGIAHGQAFYATGDDNAADGDNDAFLPVPSGGSYYWAEIMGLGIFDSATSNSAPGDYITDVAAFNGGVTIKPMDKLSLSGDIWYAQLAEDNAAGDNELGWEFDAKATYALMDNLNLDVVFAYLVAGDATGDEDPMEAGVRLSLKF